MCYKILRPYLSWAKELAEGRMASEDRPWAIAADEVGLSNEGSFLNSDGCPSLFIMRDHIGFFAIGPKGGFLYFSDARRGTAFLFPKNTE